MAAFSECCRSTGATAKSRPESLLQGTERAFDGWSFASLSSAPGTCLLSFSVMVS